MLGGGINQRDAPFDFGARMVVNTPTNETTWLTAITNEGSGKFWALPYAICANMN